jgi:hypothetical protein
MFMNYCLKNETGDAKIEKKKDDADESIQEIVTLIQFANDETDYGVRKFILFS